MSYQPPLLDFSRSDPNKGMLFDTMDGQSYPIVKIGKQIWLAENFRYLPSIKDKGDLFDTSWVYENNTDYLDLHYGRLYDWNTAMNIAPEGWRLPNNQDFIELIDFIKKDNNLNGSLIGSYLKSVNGWNKPTNIEPNSDKYGFNAKPAGYHSNYDYFYNAGSNAYFWGATESGSDGAYYWLLYYGYEDFYSTNNINKNYGFSVRLIKDS